MFWTPCRHWLLPLQQMFWTVPFCLLAGGGSSCSRCGRASSLRIYANLTDVEETNVARKRAGVGGRSCLLSEWMFVPRDHWDHWEHWEQWALPLGGKSLHAAARSRLPVKFGLRDCAHLHRTLVRFCAHSQVCGLFEGMLEKLELDDDGK